VGERERDSFSIPIPILTSGMRPSLNLATSVNAEPNSVAAATLATALDSSASNKDDAEKRECRIFAGRNFEFDDVFVFI
jgi:hypothetical protein